MKTQVELELILKLEYVLELQQHHSFLCTYSQAFVSSRQELLMAEIRATNEMLTRFTISY